ncbi:UNVERIFIED_CONTAM: hypothetical protein K2H54_010377 [Gekko kuhli]
MERERKKFALARQQDGRFGNSSPLTCVFISTGANSLELHVPKVVEAEVGKEASISCNFFLPENSSYAYVKWFYVEKNERKEILSKTQDGVDLKESDMKDRVGISDEFALTISKVTPRDARTYWCQVGAGSAGFAEKQAELRVSKAPETSVTVVSEGIGASKDELSQIATCTSQNGYPTPSITWYKDQRPLYRNGTETDIREAVTRESSGLFTVSSILSERVTKEDRNAFYHCQVDYSLMGVNQTSQTESFQIKVLYPSENINFIVDGPSKELKEGDQVTLRCKADGYPEPDYTIVKGEDQALDASAGELTLEHVKKEDSGTYYCRVLNFESMSEMEANVSLSVNYIDAPTITPEHHEALKEGDSLQLACDAKGSKPLEFKWKKQKGKPVSRGKKLSLHNVTHETLGNYSCVVTMPEVAGLVQSKHVFVNVYSKPSLTGEMHQEYVQVNELISLSCIAVAVPKATILWTAPNGTSGHSHRNGHVNSTLQIRVTPELLKSGINCTAKNNFGLAEYHFSLQKRQDPTPPSTRIDDEMSRFRLNETVATQFYGWAHEGTAGNITGKAVGSYQTTVPQTPGWGPKGTAGEVTEKAAGDNQTAVTQTLGWGPESTAAGVTEKAVGFSQTATTQTYREVLEGTAGNITEKVVEFNQTAATQTPARVPTGTAANITEEALGFNQTVATQTYGGLPEGTAAENTTDVGLNQTTAPQNHTVVQNGTAGNDTETEKEARESKGIIIVAVVVGILVIAVLGAVLYFLHKKGKLPCGRSGKQEITRPEAHKDEIVVEVKSDKLPEEAGLLQGANGEKKSAGDQTTMCRFTSVKHLSRLWGNFRGTEMDAKQK